MGITEAEYNTSREDYKRAKKELRKAIERSKRKNWAGLCDDLNRDM